MLLRKITLLITIAPLALLGGCFAPTSLSCVNDEEEGYISLTNLKDQDPILIKSYADLCSFNLKEQDNATP